MKADHKKYWTAFYTKPRNEKKAAQRLQEKGFEVYCPTRTVLKQWSDRKKKVQEVLFTSYLFAKVIEEDRQEILKDSGIASSVFWLDSPVIISDKEINGIKDFLNRIGEKSEIDFIKSGQEIKLKTGVFEGQIGTVLNVTNQSVLLQIDSLGISLVAHVPHSDLK